VVGRDWLYLLVAHDLTGQEFEVWSAGEQAQLNGLRAQGHPVDWRPEQLRIPLLGRHQVENAVVAYAALQALRDQGLPLSPEAIRAGLRSVRWPGRFEIVSRRPYLVLDGAHNRDSAQKLATTLQDYFPGRRVTLIFGASSDKDVSGMLAELLGPGTGITRVILTQAVHPRAQDPEELADMVSAFGVSPEVVSSVGHAVRLALASAKPDDVILACGSLFVVAEASAAARTGELVSD
jgi:dihydrofolate synthase / folylpolyglutamate synthase